MAADRPVPVVLSIAGSDSGGGAGIQADLKAFAAAGVHGATAITALTAQSTVGVSAVEAVSPAMVEAQVEAVAGDLGVDAVKIGMLGDVATIEAVARALDRLPAGTPVVHDPVMVAESGARLLAQDAMAALIEQVLPRATVITPNLPEAQALVEEGARGAGACAGDLDGEALARALHGLGPAVVVVTGGHRDEVTDLVFDGVRLDELPSERHADGAAHGSGCTHSSTLAAHLALGSTPLEAARAAREASGAAVRDGLRGLGAGAGPVDVLGLTRAADVRAKTRRAIPPSVARPLP
ncbi:MAG: bifunctional hydroxymethylpyrimidine kinase/phosphomethylpyrimidine kinase [Solirubrobacteraceae bacterium MAG38_C4-C5]|nr:bifunctional hydroxymethylpyrimidine kinase/phosphomethylpyrimidine kinase [Candidatus Siliceabacter maunaloa]